MSSSGVFYFCDMGLAMEEMHLYVDFFEVKPGDVFTVIHSRELSPEEYKQVNAPKGIIGLDIKLDTSLDQISYDYAEYKLEGLLGEAGKDLRRFRMHANGLQFVPSVLYLYRIEMNGLPKDIIQTISSDVIDPYRFTHDGQFVVPLLTMEYKETAGELHGFNDGDTIYLVSGEKISFTLNTWYEPGGSVAFYDVEKNLQALKVGESITMTARGVGLGEGPTLTITKAATLRGGEAEAERADEAAKTQQLNDLIHGIVQGNK